MHNIFWSSSLANQNLVSGYRVCGRRRNTNMQYYKYYFTFSFNENQLNGSLRFCSLNRGNALWLMYWSVSKKTKQNNVIILVFPALTPYFGCNLPTPIFICATWKWSAAFTVFCCVFSSSHSGCFSKTSSTASCNVKKNMDGLISSSKKEQSCSFSRM